MSTQRPLTVTEISGYIKTLLDKDEILSQVAVAGELSNYKIHSTGHHYFTLKDDGAVISAVMFRAEAGRLKFRPESGMKVILYGRVSSFPRSGQYQIYVSHMQPDGVGALYVAFEQLKAKLQAEGLFAKSHKKPLPPFPGRVALVTSPTGAAVRDMIRILGRRFPACEVLVCPVKVQGEGAAEEIAAMIRYVDAHKLADVIITGRGGGSIEDLWAFNEEIVARAIYECELPVISAVGHEPDITISDYVADVRAATPSNAAELAVYDAAELKTRLRNAYSRIYQSEARIIGEKGQRLAEIKRKRILSEPEAYLTDRRMYLELLRQKMEAAEAKRLSLLRERFAAVAATMDAISPLKVIKRGYSIAESGGRIIRSTDEVAAGDRVDVRLTDGRLLCVVENKVKEG